MTTYSTFALRSGRRSSRHPLHVQPREIRVIERRGAFDLFLQLAYELFFVGSFHGLTPVRGDVDRDAGAHRAGDRDVLDVHALGRGRLGADDLIHERGEVRLERLETERDLSDRRVDVPRLVDAELDLTGLRLAARRCRR